MVARLLRIASRIVLILLVLLLVVWIGAAVAIKYTMMEEEPLPMIMTVVGQGLVSSISCAVTGCPAELLEGMESVPFGEGWVESTVVALDVDEHGRVLVAETERQNRGAEDNRQHMYWLEDDLDTVVTRVCKALGLPDEHAANWRQLPDPTFFPEPEETTPEEEAEISATLRAATARYLAARETLRDGDPPPKPPWRSSG